jgi:hypothetical protein
MKKYLLPFAFISCFFFYGCFFLLLINSYRTKTIMPSSKKEAVENTQTYSSAETKTDNSDFLSSK